MEKVAALLISALMIAPSFAFDVVTTVKPLQLITHELTKGVSEPVALLGSNTSPHDYALKPSDVKKIARADLVIWYGKALEPFLEKVVASHHSVLTLSKEPITYREFGTEEQHDDHHDHSEHAFDPHFWLGIDAVAQVAERISQQLIKLDNENTSIYKNNLILFKSQLSSLDKTLSKQLAAVSGKGYYVFHDAYGYFEEHYGLNNLGHFTVSPERKPGAKTLIKIKRRLAKGDVKCVFSEPQFTPAVIDSATRGTNVNKGVLDPLGSAIKVQDGAYFEFLQTLADSYTHCLMPSSM